VAKDEAVSDREPGPADSAPTDRAPDGASDPCSEALVELYHFLAGELTDARRVTIQVHLDGCSSCLEVFDFEAELRAVVAERGRDRVPEEFRLRIAAMFHLEVGDDDAGR
jgi:mycothiol system anti-sigma-R factor